jgi:hypothetical protein
MTRLAIVAAMLLIAGCADASREVPMSTGASTSTAAALSSRVPAEVLPGCGHPGGTIVIHQSPITIRHADCDLTGVIIDVGGVGAVVPSAGWVAGDGDYAAGSKPSGATEINISVDPTTRDVTITSG